MTTLAVVDLPLLGSLEKSAPQFLPHDDTPGDPIPTGHPALEGERRLLVFGPEALWGFWSTWNTALFEAERVGESGSTTVQLLRRVERWNLIWLEIFCCRWARTQVQLEYVRFSPEDTRPMQAIDTAEAYLRGAATGEELERARVAAWEAADALPNLRVNVFRATGTQQAKVQARKAAEAAATLTEIDAEGRLPEDRARRAVDLAFEARCFNRGGWIAAKVVGRQREVALLEFLGVGTEMERKAIDEGKDTEGKPVGSRYIWAVETAEPSDVTQIEDRSE